MAREDLEAMPNGATAPVPYFDPLGLANAVDDQELQKYREAEVKHGRVAMVSRRCETSVLSSGRQANASRRQANATHQHKSHSRVLTSLCSLQQSMCAFSPQLAALGMIVQENFHPFFDTQSQDLGPAVYHLQKVHKVECEPTHTSCTHAESVD